MSKFFQEHIKDPATGVLVPVSGPGGNGDGGEVVTKLYENSAGQNAAFTLSEPVTNFDFIRVKYSVGASVYEGSVRIDIFPATNSLWSCQYANTGSGIQFLTSARWTVSGINVTPQYFASSSFVNATPVALNSTANSIYIYSVEGIKQGAGVAPTAKEMAWVPDYANQESINRITTNSGTWTADRDGFVSCFVSYNGNGGTYVITDFYVNNVQVTNKVEVTFGALGAANPTNFTHKPLPIEVKSGDVVKINSITDMSITTRTFGCYYIPPVAVLPPTVDTSAFLTVHAAIDETDAVTNSSTNSGLWWW